MTDKIYIDFKTENELKKKAEAENFQDVNELVNFLVDEALKQGIKREPKSYGLTQPRNKRPELVKGDLCKITKRAKNQSWHPRNATYVVLEVGTTILGRYQRYGKRKSVIVDGAALCVSSPGFSERRVDPSNGYCSIKVAYKQNGKWIKTSIHRKDLYRINR